MTNDSVPQSSFVNVISYLSIVNGKSLPTGGQAWLNPMCTIVHTFTSFLFSLLLTTAFLFYPTCLFSFVFNLSANSCNSCLSFVFFFLSFSFAFNPTFLSFFLVLGVFQSGERPLRLCGESCLLPCKTPPLFYNNPQ
jgi:hypothetical protein